jgi:alkylhydroperoxidase family enzyme
VTEKRGKVSDEDLAAVREAGFTDAQVIEIVATAVEFLFTNFINNVAATDIDFPVETSAT